MKQYIDKAAVVAEIKRRIDFCNKIADACAEGNLHNSLEANELLIRQYENLLSFLDTFEVKGEGFKPMDSDFERDAVSFCLDNGLNTTPYIAKTIAKHFFELGLKAQKGE